MSQGVARVVAGRYRLLGQLGRGGMGVVWQARDGVLDRDVVLKEIHLSGMGADSADPLAARALREARAAAQLRHPAIITVHDVVIEEGRPWIVMELIDGPSLGQLVADEGAFSEQRVAAIGLRVLEALRVAHRRGILHRDVKPPNILLDGDRVVLTDFGIAAIDGATALTATGQMVGSPAYLAPERINGRPATPAADLWALGVSLYVAVSGRSPFRRDDALSTFAAVLTSDPVPPPGAGRLWPVIEGLLVKDPARRLTAERAGELLATVAYPATVPVGPTRLRWPHRLRPRKHADVSPPARRRLWPPRQLAAPTEEERPTVPAASTVAAAEAVAVPTTLAQPTAPNIRGVSEPPAILAPPLPGAEASPVRHVVARRRRRPTVRLIGFLTVAALLPAAALAGDLPAQFRRGTTGEPAADSGVRPARTMAASPDATRIPSPASPTPTPPAPPTGFRTVHVDGPLYLAIPQSWVVKDDDIGKRLQPEGSTSWPGFVYAAKAKKGVSAADYLRDYVADPGQDYRLIRLTSVATPRGGSNAAEREYTKTLYNEKWHSLDKAVTLPTGATYIVSFSLSARTSARLRTDWKKAQPTFREILDSAWLSPR